MICSLVFSTLSFSPCSFIYLFTTFGTVKYSGWRFFNLKLDKTHLLTHWWTKNEFVLTKYNSFPVHVAPAFFFFTSQSIFNKIWLFVGGSGINLMIRCRAFFFMIFCCCCWNELESIFSDSKNIPSSKFKQIKIVDDNNDGIDDSMRSDIKSYVWYVLVVFFYSNRNRRDMFMYGFWSIREEKKLVPMKWRSRS